MNWLKSTSSRTWKQMCIDRGIGRAHVIARLGEAGAAAGRLIGVAILQQLDHDVVELDEPHVQPLRAAAQVRHAHRPRIDLRARASMSWSVSSVLWMRSPWKSPSRITSVPPSTSV